MTARAPDEMSCRELVQLVTDYLEGALSIDDRTRLEHHLAFCPYCVNYLQQMRDVLKVTGRLSEGDVPAVAQQQLLQAFRGWNQGGA